LREEIALERGAEQADSMSPAADDPTQLPRPASGRELKDVLEAERAGLPFLLYRDAEGVQRLHVLEPADAVTIGRGEGVEVGLSWDPRVSSLHAELIHAGAHWLITDEGISRNGTFVNGHRLSGRRRLRHGDLVRVGHTSLAFNSASGEQAEGTIALDTEGNAPQITEAQQRVLSALCRPYRDRSAFATPPSNLEIADELYLSVEAVKTHLRELYRRFALEALPQKEKRSKLVEQALQLGLGGQQDP
jgi:pSer/pThr/pTyr-binding forkhead associated (FHA) protein